jgi:hypothetical protein
MSICNRSIQSELLQSYIYLIRNALRRWGLDLAKVSNGNTPYYFHDLMQRYPVVKPRRVLLSKEIEESSEKLELVNFLRRKVEAGGDIWPHLSRKWGELKNLDKLCSNWGVYHLHLGEYLEAHGYVSRTQKVLLLLINQDDMRFIDVCDHGKGFPDLWYDIEIMNIVLRNWPDQLASYKSSMTGHNVSLSTVDQVREYRKYNSNIPMLLEDGNVYLGPGFVSAQGLSSFGAMYHGETLRFFGVVDQIWREKPHELAKAYFPWRIPPENIKFYVDRVWPMVRVRAEGSDKYLDKFDAWNLAGRVLD